MQMKMINLASVSRKKGNGNTYDEIIPSKSPHVLNKIEDFKNIVVMSGTATRKPTYKNEKNHTVKIFEKNSFRENFMKLRAPYKSHHKQIHAEEKLMTRSCEILFECIKPCKAIRVARKSHSTESETIGSIFKTNAVIYEKKATRKIQFMSISEEIPSQCFLWDECKTSQDSFPTSFVDFNMEKFHIQNEMNSLTFDEREAEASKTISSEDFVTNAFSGAA